MESWAVSVVVGVVTFAICAFEGRGVRGTCVSFVGVSASATVGGVRFAVVTFVTKTLTTQALNGFFFQFVGVDSSIQDGRTFFQDFVCSGQVTYRHP